MGKKYKIMDFAYLGDKKTFDLKMQSLIEIAEKEKWSSNGDNNNDILRNYIFNTFEKCYDDDLIEYAKSGSYALINLGLFTNNSQEIFMLFEQNIPAKQHLSKWLFKRYIKEDDYMIRHFDSLPKHPTYFEDYSVLFLTDKRIVLNMDHIFEDRKNRIHEIIEVHHPTRFLDKQDFIEFIDNKINKTMKKVFRNPRLVVPMYYRDAITYLIPIKIGPHILPVALEDIGACYRANTILTRDMGYKNARLLMRPESHWLLR